MLITRKLKYQQNLFKLLNEKLRAKALLKGICVLQLGFVPNSYGQEPLLHCRAKALEIALESSPGIDEFSSATVVHDHVVEVFNLGEGVQREKFFVTTEDQGGLASSLITLKYQASEDLARLTKNNCTFEGQEWIE